MLETLKTKAKNFLIKKTLWNNLSSCGDLCLFSFDIEVKETCLILKDRSYYGSSFGINKGYAALTIT